MTATDAIDPAKRRDWLAVLARAGTAELERAFAHWPAAGGAERIRMPETGMVMLRGRIGGTGDAFNLGEATVTRCAVRIGAALGVGYALGRDRRKAELIAAFDALLQDAQLRADLLLAVVEPLRRAQQAQREARSREAAASRVEFFTLVRGET